MYVVHVSLLSSTGINFLSQKTVEGVSAVLAFLKHLGVIVFLIIEYGFGDSFNC